MTNGVVVVLGSVSHNVGAGMTGGKLFLLAEFERFVNGSYLKGEPLTKEEACATGAFELGVAAAAFPLFLAARRGEETCRG